ECRGTKRGRLYRPPRSTTMTLEDQRDFSVLSVRRRIACPGGSRASSSATVNPRRGCRHCGAISWSGISTKRLSWSRGCGSTRSGAEHRTDPGKSRERRLGGVLRRRIPRRRQIAADTDENHRRASSTALGLTRDLSGTTLSHIFDLAGVIDDFLSGRAYRDIYRRRQPIFRGSWAGFRYRLQATARSVSLERPSDPRVLLHGAGGRPRILADPAAGRLARL